MCRNVTASGFRTRQGGVLLSALFALSLASAQTPAAARNEARPDWRHIGNSAVELELASPASGAADRVWFSVDGARLFVRTTSGRVFETLDFEKWQPSTAVAPEDGWGSDESASDWRP